MNLHHRSKQTPAFTLVCAGLALVMSTLLLPGKSVAEDGECSLACVECKRAASTLVKKVLDAVLCNRFSRKTKTGKGLCLATKASGTKAVREVCSQVCPEECLTLEAELEALLNVPGAGEICECANDAERPCPGRPGYTQYCSGCFWIDASDCTPILPACGCEPGYDCDEDGDCCPQPRPDYRSVDGSCKSSCGYLLQDILESNDFGLGCCAYGCEFEDGFYSTHDCSYCCTQEQPGEQVCLPRPACFGKPDGTHCGYNLPEYWGSPNHRVYCVGEQLESVGYCTSGCLQPGQADAYCISP